jgi:retron-type reverse transcriptase
MSRGNVAVKVNDNVGHYFQTRKGVQQGDPLSPILFNILVDMLAILISRAKEVDQIQGVVHIWLMRDFQSFSMQMTLSSLWAMI